MSNHIRKIERNILARLRGGNRTFPSAEPWKRNQTDKRCGRIRALVQGAIRRFYADRMPGVTIHGMVPDRPTKSKGPNDRVKAAMAKAFGG